MEESDDHARRLEIERPTGAGFILRQDDRHEEFFDRRCLQSSPGCPFTRGQLMTKAKAKSFRAGGAAMSKKDKHVPRPDGSTPATAIIEDQNVWRRRNCPGFTLALQRLMGIDGKYFDELTLWSEDEVRVVYFDVSNLFAQVSAKH
jgi:hypothetical protein